MAENEVNRTLAVMQAVTRLEIGRALGQFGYGGDRNYQEALGYEESPTFDTYNSRYQRQDIAARVVDLPAQDTWKRPPAITENEKDDTQFVIAWKELVKRLRVWAMLSRLDRIAGIGRYGLLLIGTRVEGDLETPVTPGQLKTEADILYIRPYTEAAAAIEDFVDDPNDPRFGLPLMYKVTPREDADEQLIHWTRVLHIADNKVSSENYGIPRLRQVLNRLDDLLKVVGGSAEATWLNMRPGTILSEKDDYDLANDSASQTALDEAIRKYAHDPLRMLRLTGVDAKQLGVSEVIDPSGPFGVIISLIAAASGIPQRVLLGSAAGELASGQEDRKQWGDAISFRQKNFAEPDVLRAFIDRLMWYGALPTVEYDVGTADENGEYHWPPLIESTEAEVADIQASKASAWKSLEDPQTGDAIGDRNEARALMGMPEDLEYEIPEPKEIPAALQPFTEPGTPEAVVAQVKANYERGEVSLEDYAEFVIAEMMEAGQ